MESDETSSNSAEPNCGSDPAQHGYFVTFETRRFNIDNVLLRGMKMMNTKFALCAVLFTGVDTRVMRCNVSKRSKSSRIEQRLNKILLLMVGCVVAFSIIFTILSIYGVNFEELRKQIYFAEESDTTFKVGITRFLQLIIITSYFLPISLIVNMELSRFF